MFLTLLWAIEIVEIWTEGIWVRAHPKLQTVLWVAIRIFDILGNRIKKGHFMHLGNGWNVWENLQTHSLTLVFDFHQPHSTMFTILQSCKDNLPYAIWQNLADDIRQNRLITMPFFFHPLLPATTARIPKDPLRRHKSLRRRPTELRLGSPRWDTPPLGSETRPCLHGVCACGGWSRCQCQGQTWSGTLRERRHGEEAEEFGFELRSLFLGGLERFDRIF